MWFECTFVFTMLEPWEKILCGEYARDEGLWSILNNLVSQPWCS